MDILKHNEKYSIVHGAGSVLPNAFVSTYISMFMISVLEASTYQVALASSIPQILGVVVLVPTAIWVNYSDSKKKLTMYSTILARFLLLLMIFIPLIPAYGRIACFIALISIMHIPLLISDMSWQAMIADLIPERCRALFFAKRNRIVALTSIISVAAIGIVMWGQNPSNPTPYRIIILICMISAVIEVLSIRRHKEQPYSETREKTKHVSIFSKKIFTHKPYRAFLICALAFNFCWQMTWPLISIYNVTYCETNIFWISLFSVANQLAQFIFFPIWGRLSRKYPISVLLVVNALGMAVASALWVLSTNLFWIVAINFVSGIFVSGIVLLLFNGLLEYAREDMKTAFVTNYNFLLGFVAIIAPQVGVLLLEVLSIQQSVWASSILRAICAGMFAVMAIYMRRIKVDS